MKKYLPKRDSNNNFLFYTDMSIVYMDMEEVEKYNNKCDIEKWHCSANCDMHIINNEELIHIYSANAIACFPWTIPKRVAEQLIGKESTINGIKVIINVIQFNELLQYASVKSVYNLSKNLSFLDDLYYLPKTEFEEILINSLIRYYADFIPISF